MATVYLAEIFVYMQEKDENNSLNLLKKAKLCISKMLIHLKSGELSGQM